MVPSNVLVKLGVMGSSMSVTVDTGSSLEETDSSFHTDIDRSTIRKAAARERVVFAEFDCDVVVAGRLGRLEWTVSWAG